MIFVLLYASDFFFFFKFYEIIQFEIVVWLENKGMLVFELQKIMYKSVNLIPTNIEKGEATGRTK